MTSLPQSGKIKSDHTLDSPVEAMTPFPFMSSAGLSGNWGAPACGEEATALLLSGNLDEDAVALVLVVDGSHFGFGGADDMIRIRELDTETDRSLCCSDAL